MLTIELPKNPARYWYKVRTDQIRVIDGDTIECHTDLTHGVYVDAVYRLASINAPEMKGRTKKAAEAAARYANDWIRSRGEFVWIKSLKNRGNDKMIQTFGRYVAYVFAPDGRCLNLYMVESGHAVPYMIELITEDSFEVKK